MLISHEFKYGDKDLKVRVGKYDILGTTINHIEYFCRDNYFDGWINYTNLEELPFIPLIEKWVNGGFAGLTLSEYLDSIIGYETQPQ